MTDPRSNNTPGWHVRRVAETGSTNADLLAAAAGGAPHGTVLVTDHQTAGKGRLGRVWDAPPGANLLVSVLFRHGFDPTRPHELTQRVAVAAARAAERVAGVVPDLKWPNDLLIDGAKLAGILAQAAAGGRTVGGAAGGRTVGGAAGGRTVGGEGVDHVVVGMGLNLGWAPEGAAHLPGVDRDAFLAAWLEELADGFAAGPIGPEYRRRLATLGQRVRVELPGGMIDGVAVDVADDGALIVEQPGGGRHVVSAGDVHHLRPAG